MVIDGIYDTTFFTSYKITYIKFKVANRRIIENFVFSDWRVHHAHFILFPMSFHLKRCHFFIIYLNSLLRAQMFFNSSEGVGSLAADQNISTNCRLLSPSQNLVHGGEGIH